MNSEIKEAAEAANDHGKALFAQRKWAEALEAFREAVRLAGADGGGGDPKYSSNEAAACVMLQDWDGAVQACERALEMELQDPKLAAKLWRQLGEARLKKGELDVAIEALEMVQALEPLSEADKKMLKELLQRQGRKLMAQGQWDRAIDSFSRALKLAPKDPQLLCDRSEALLKRWRFKEALSDTNECMKAAPRWNQGYLRAGAVRRAICHLDLAEQVLSKGLQQCPGDEEMQRALGELQRFRAENGEALEKAKKLFDLGHESYKRGNFAAAEQSFSQCLEIRSRVLGEEHPDTLGLMSNLASAYSSQGWYKEAEELHSR